MADDEDPVAAAKKLPLPDRVVHTHWKVREAAYRELVDKFLTAQEDSKIYPDFAPLLGKLVRDANAAAQLVGLDAVAKFADRAPPQLVRRTAADVGKGIAEKALAGRPINKQRASDTVLMFVGADAGELILETFTNAGFRNSSPKVVATALDVVRESILTYGVAAVSIKQIAPGLHPLLQHSQESVRKATKALILEIHRWIGDAVRPVLKDASDAILKELDAAFKEHVGKPKPTPLKLTRAMEQRQRNAPAGAATGDDEDHFAAGGAVPEEDDLDLAEEINLLESLPKMKFQIDEGTNGDWFAAVEHKKWSVRKDALSAVTETIGTARLTPGVYTDIFSRLRKIIEKDANVNVVACAAKLLAALATGLRKNFAPAPARVLTVALFGRLKESNRVVTDGIANALDTLHAKRCIRLCELCDEVSAATESKVPKVRSEVLRWVQRCLQQGTSPADLQGSTLKSFANILVKATEDQASEVRDTAILAIAALQVLVGERSMQPFYEKLDKIRLDKIAVAVKDAPKPSRVVPPKVPPGAAAPGTARRSPKRTSKGNAKPVAAPNGDRPSSRPAVKSETKSSESLRPMESDDEGEIGLSDEMALVSATEMFDGFSSDSWTGKSPKARMEAAEAVISVVRERSSVSMEQVEVVLGVLRIAPGLADGNMTALKAKLELLGLIVDKCEGPPPRKTLRAIMEPVVDKLGDIRYAVVASEICLKVAEATSARHLFLMILQALGNAKDARAKLGIVKFATSVLQQFGTPACPVDQCMTIAVELLKDSSIQLRNAAIAFAVETATRSAEGLVRAGLLAGSLEDKCIELFDAELGKRDPISEDPPRIKRFMAASSRIDKSAPVTNLKKPTMKVSFSAPPPDVARSSMSYNVSQPEQSIQVISEGIVPAQVHVNIAHEFDPSTGLLKRLASSDWKTRQTALREIDEIAKTHSAIDENVGPDVMSALRARLSDSNRNLAALAYNVSGRLGRAMGVGAVVHVKVIIPVVVGAGCVDIKKNVRDSALTCLEQWFQAVGLSPLLPYLNTPLTSLNPGIRKEYLEWLVPRVRGEVGSFNPEKEDLSQFIDPVLSCMRDRTVEVRHLAEAMLDCVIANVGFLAVDTRVLTLTKSDRLQLEPFLGKYRGSKPATVPPSTSARPGMRASQRDRPRSVQSPGRPVASSQVVEIMEPRTPTGGLRRPVSLRPTNINPVETAARTGRNTAVVEGVDKVTNVLRRGSGRNTRAQRVALRKTLVGRESTDMRTTMQFIEEFVAEKPEDVTMDLRECLPEAFVSKMMAPSIRFQGHVESIDDLTSRMREDPDSLVLCADVLLRWAAFRINDARTPPTVLQKAGEFISSVCEVLQSSGSCLEDYEASALIPVLVEKCGSNRNVVREAMLGALVSVADIIDDAKLIAYLVLSAWSTTSMRSKIEVMSLLPTSIDRLFNNGGQVPAEVVHMIALIAGEADDGLGRVAAVCIDRIHHYVGDVLWDMIGELSAETAELLETRLAQVLGASASVLTDPASSPPAGPLTMDPHVGSSPIADRENNRYGMIPTAAAQALSIRAGDFRLSVAPTPPASVMSLLSGSKVMQTPIRGGKVFDVSGGVTPALPMRKNRGRGHFSFISSQQPSHVQSLIDLLESDVGEDQIQGLDLLLDEILQPQGTALKDSVSDILPLVSRGFRECVERLAAGSLSVQDTIILKKQLNALMTYVSEREVTANLDQRTVEQFLSDTLEGMIPDEIQAIPDWDRDRRRINLGVLKVLESADRNLLYCSLLHLMKCELRPGEVLMLDPSAKSLLLIKSCAKVTKRGFKGMELDVLVRDLHLFLEDLGCDSCLDCPLTTEGQPFDLVRSVIDAAVDDVRDRMSSAVGLIPSPKSSSIVEYLSNVMSASAPPVSKPNRQDISRNDDGPTDPQQSPANPAKHEAPDSANQENALSAIFRSLTLSGGDEVGLHRLKLFLQSNPYAKIDNYLSQCPESCREYIQNGLDVHVGDRNTVQGEVSGMSGMTASPIQKDAIAQSTSESAGQAYLKRLREIQVKYGLPERSGITGSDVREEAVMNNSDPQLLGDLQVSEVRTAIGEKENGLADQAPVPSVSETRDKATALRERMARIREASAE